MTKKKSKTNLVTKIKFEDNVKLTGPPLKLDSKELEKIIEKSFDPLEKFDPRKAKLNPNVKPGNEYHGLILELAEEIYTEIYKDTYKSEFQIGKDPQYSSDIAYAHVKEFAKEAQAIIEGSIEDVFEAMRASAEGNSAAWPRYVESVKNRIKLLALSVFINGKRKRSKDIVPEDVLDEYEKRKKYKI